MRVWTVYLLVKARSWSEEDELLEKIVDHDNLRRRLMIYWELKTYPTMAGLGMVDVWREVRWLLSGSCEMIQSAEGT